ncbi:MAG: hypothetical protein IAE89_03460 [Anaerolineae bacterium]|nr:hypothetical protein [Anaerolineae bacterium]
MNKTKPTPDPIAELRNLANKWTLLARDYARDAKNGDAVDPRTPYHRGLAEGYYKAALELAELIKQFPESGIASVPIAAAPASSSAPQRAAPPPQPQAPPPEYLNLQVSEVLNILSYAGTNPRDVTPNKGVGTYTAVFSRWENLMPHERIEMIKAADHRLVVIGSGKTRDAGDPFIEIAFKEL